VSRYLGILLCALCLGFYATPSVAEPPSGYPLLNKTASLQKTGADDVAVVVAVEDYVFLPHVNGATTNGSDWESFFQDSLGVGTVHFVSNSQATKEELKRFAKLAAANSKPGATVWFVFIGHGAPSKDGGEGLLVGADAQSTPESLFARGMPQQELLNILQAGKQAQTVLVVDACFSGRAGSGDALVKAQPVIPTSIQPIIASSTVVLSAARADEFAGPLPGVDRPAFSYLLLGALRGWAVGTGDVTAQGAQRYVERALRGIPGRMNQTPSIFGNGAVVLTRGVREADPGIADLMRKMAREPQTQVILPSDIKITMTEGSKNGIPSLPSGLNPNGAISFSVDADVLIARDQALQIDANGADNPLEASAAWAKLAAMDSNNPFREEAAERARQWSDFAQKQHDLGAQKESDFMRIAKVLPLTSVSVQNKLDLLKSFGGLYGSKEMADLIRHVEPAELRLDLCKPYIREGVVPVQVRMPLDRDSNAFMGKIEVAGQILGTAPGEILLPICADQIGITVTESESQKKWTGTIQGFGGSDPTIIEPNFDDLVPYSIWHDYIWADAPSGPLLGVMYSQMFFPASFSEPNRQTIRGNVELGLGGFASHVSVWFEPSMVLAQDDHESSIGLAGGAQLGRFSAGRFSLSPLRVGYQNYSGADLDGLKGFTGQSALRFHVGKGVQLRGDVGILRGEQSSDGKDWDGYIWSAGGGLEYGNPVVANALGSVLSSSDHSGDDWYEWTEGSVSLGYHLQGGFIAGQPMWGTFVMSAKGAESYEDGGYVTLEGAHADAGGLGTSNFTGRFGMASLGDDEDYALQYGFIAGYNNFEDGGDYYMVGVEFQAGWQVFDQVSLNLYAAANIMSLFSADPELDDLGQEIPITDSKMSPVAAYLRWVTPWQLYLNGGVRYGVGDYDTAQKFGGFGEVGYLWSLE